MRALLVVCLLADIAVAGSKLKHTPVNDPLLAAAEHLWTVAENEQDPAKQTAAWDAAADAFIIVVDAGKLPPAIEAEAAQAAVLALKNSLNSDPRIASNPPAEESDVIPLREQRMIHVIEVRRRFDASSDDAVGLEFLQANILRRHHHYVAAIPLYLDLINNHRTHETAEYAATLLLDSYNLQGDYTQLIALVERLRADKAFLAGKPDLAATVDKLHAQSLRKTAEQTEKAARDANDQALYERAGEQYLDSDGTDEAIYNALICFRVAGSLDRARAAAQQLAKQFPRSRLLAKARLRMFAAEADTGNFAGAAAIAEDLAKWIPGEKDVQLALFDAIDWRISLGDFAAASRDIDVAKKASRDAASTTSAGVRLVEALLTDGKRDEAARRAAKLPATAAPMPRLRRARALADAACPVPLVDGLCSKPRDAKLLATARHELAELGANAAALPDITREPAELATRATLELDLEDALANRTTARATELVTDAYRELAAPTKPPEQQVIAHARLGRLAAHAGKADDAVTQLRACIGIASSALVGAEWIASCERELRTLGEPAPGVPERVPAPIALVAPVLDR